MKFPSKAIGGYGKEGGIVFKVFLAAKDK